jgi:hypothetical protein
MDKKIKGLKMAKVRFKVKAKDGEVWESKATEKTAWKVIKALLELHWKNGLEIVVEPVKED